MVRDHSSIVSSLALSHYLFPQTSGCQWSRIFHNTTNQIFRISVILVTGGKDGSGLTSVEVFSAAGTSLCTALPPLPTTRYGHTQDGVLSCGGVGGSSTCVKLSALAGGWVESNKLLQVKSGHSSWMSPAGLVLMGGVYSPTTTERLSSSDSSSSYSFNLQNKTE